MKISLIGAGMVGGAICLNVCEKELADEVVMVDIAEGIPQGKALDIAQALPLCGCNVKVTGSNTYDAIDGSDIIAVTAGVPRKPGMTRDDLVGINSKIISSIAKEIRERAPDSVVIVVTNPLDVMAHLMLKETGFPKERVIGMAGVLDSTRFRTFIAMETGAKVQDVEAMVLGGHGDSMVPLAAHTTVEGRPITEVLPEEKVEAIVQRTKDGGAEIVKLLKSGSAYFAPGASVGTMIEAMVKNNDAVLPCSVMLEGEYGYSGIFLGVPVRLFEGGVKEVVEFDLSDDEKALLDKSAEHVKKLIEETIG